MMAKLKCTTSLKTGTALLFVLMLGFAFMLSAGGAPSRSNSNGVYGELVTTGGDNLTAGSANEVFNFTVNNTNASLFIDQIIIYVPLSGDYAAFANSSAVGISNSSWSCTTPSVGGDGKFKMILCFNSSDGNELGNGSIINITFNASPKYTNTEAVYQWNVSLKNLGGYNFSFNISSGIDGLAPRLSYNPTATQAGNRSQNWVFINVSVTELNLNTISYNLSNSTYEGVLNTTWTGNDTVNFWVNKTGLADGYYSFYVFANDTLGNGSATTPRTVTLDTQAPLLWYNTSTTSSGYYNYSQNWIFINVTMSGGAEFVAFNLSAPATSGVLSTSWTGNDSVNYWVNATGLVEGNYSFFAFANDSANNINTTAPRLVVLDFLAPSLSYNTNTTTEGNHSQNWILINVSVTELNMQNISYNLSNSTGEGILNSTWTGSAAGNFWVSKTNLADGYYSFYVFANDTTGNSSVTATRTALLDTNAPSLSVLYPENKTYNYTSGITLNYSASDAFGLDSCWYSLNSTSNTTLASCANSTLPALSEGPQNVTVYADDTTGNLRTATRYFTVDTSSPSVTLISPNSAWYAITDTILFEYRPYDAYSNLINCTLWMTNDTGQNWSINWSNVTIYNNIINNFTATGFANGTDENGNYSWNVQCWDNANHSAFAPANFTFYVGNRPNLVVGNITPRLNPTPYVGLANLTINVTVSNNGTTNVINSTSIKFCFGQTVADPCTSALYMNESVVVPAASVTKNANYTVSYVVNVNGSEGEYYIYAMADATNNETYERSNTDNTLISSFSTSLNVTILNVTLTNQSSAYPEHDKNVSVRVKVQYYNGTSVPGLQLANLSVYDYWVNGSTAYRLQYYNRTSNFSDQGSGVYVFNYTVPGLNSNSYSSYNNRFAEYDLHYLKVAATENSTGHVFSGTSSGETSTNLYHLVAPYLRVVSSGASLAPGESNVENAFTLYNDGIDNLTAQVDLSVNFTDAVLSSGHIGEPSSKYFTASEINENGYKGGQVHLSASASAAAGSYTVKINATTIHKGILYWYTKIITVDIENNTAPNDEDGNNGITNPVTYCLNNGSCASDSWCNKSLKCQKLTCPDGYYATNHLCKIKQTFEVNINKYDRSVYLTQGDSAVKSVYVKNTGNQNLTVLFAVELTGEGLNATSTPASADVAIGDTANFTVNIVTSSTTPIGNYTGKYKATTSSTAKDTVSFTVAVAPLASTIREIEADYQNYTTIVTQLLSEFERIKASGQLSAQNLTLLELKINATRLLLNNTKAAWDSGNYMQVTTLLNDLRTLLNQTNTLMGELGVTGAAAGGDFWNNIVMWLVVGIICIGAVGLLIYMLVPPQGYTLGKGYAPAGKSKGLSKWLNKLKEAPASLMRRKGRTGGEVTKKFTQAYSGGYTRVSGSYGQERKKGGILSKIFRRNK